MKVKTSRFVELDVPREKIIHMPLAVVGFQESYNYFILDHSEDSPFKWMQSADEPDLAFVIIDPYTFKPDYDIEVTEDDLVPIQTNSVDEIVIATLVSIHGDPRMMTANLLAPLLVNYKKMLGMQTVLNNSDYSTRVNILDEMNRNQKEIFKREQECKKKQFKEQEAAVVKRKVV
ncbi:MAG: flagellar assembly protein FliW [bacterium]